LCFAEASAGAKKEGPPPTKAERRAIEELTAGSMYEASSRYAEAESAYAKAIADGNAETKQLALEALRRVVLARGTPYPDSQLRLGEKYENEGRLVEAEASYAKALESGSPTVRAEALRKIARIIERRETLYEQHLRPLWGPAAKTLITLVGLFSLLALLQPLVKSLGRLRHRHSLGVSGFGTADQPGFGAALTAMHELMEVHFRPRGVIPSPKMPALIQSQSAQISELVSSVNPSLIPFAKWIAAVWYQPAYRIAGNVDSTLWSTKVYATLTHSGNTIGRWSRVVAGRDWHVEEENLAYEILIRLKEHVDANAS